MRLNDLVDELAPRLEPPVTDEDVVEVVGDLVLESPRGTEETVAEVLARQGAETFGSVEEVAVALHSNVCWEFVGRRRYDDRAPNVGDRDDESF
jgi:hypothetical protein